jgi:hypothetical protein
MVRRVARKSKMYRFQQSQERDKILLSGMHKLSHLSATPFLKRFRRGRHDRGR